MRNIILKCQLTSCAFIT